MREMMLGRGRRLCKESRVVDGCHIYRCTFDGIRRHAEP